MVDELPNQPRKGRGAVSNAAGRYEPHTRVQVDDGWYHTDPDEPLPKLRTEVTPERVKTPFGKNSSPDLPFDLSLNPYRGCEHGCVYCYARPTHAYMNLSPGLDFESKLFVKTNLAEALEAELRKPAYRPRPIMIGANTDPYQPIEREHQITRQLLEVLREYRNPVMMVTKNHLVTRDLDILSDLAADNLVSVAVSITTLDGTLARHMEPRASTPKKRLETMRELSSAGVPVTLLAAPMIPTLNDFELESILEAAHEHGASAAAYILLRLPLELKELFGEWLETHAPTKAKRVMSLLSQSRGGQAYQSEFTTRMTGTGVHAQLLSQRFKLACKKLGLNEADVADHHLNTTLFTRPPRPGDQLGLF